MKKQIPWNLLGKYFSEEISETDYRHLMQWVKKDRLHRRIFAELHEVWENTSGTQQWDIDTAWKRVNKLTSKSARQEKSSNVTVLSKYLENKKRRFRWKWPYAAVAAVLLMVAFVMVYSHMHQSIPVKPFKKIVTLEGEQSRIKLRDGSVVTLNESSTLRIPKKFSRSNRSLHLKGEAFFDVKHDAAHPFKVYSRGAVIQDLGTRFNVKADPLSHNVQVAVINGKVALYREGTTLKSGGLLTRNSYGELNLIDNHVSIEKVDARNYVSWLSGRLVFDNLPLSKISHQLERLYKVQFQFSDTKLREARVTADFKKTTLRDALDIISGSLGIHYELHNATVLWKR